MKRISAPFRFTDSRLARGWIFLGMVGFLLAASVYTVGVQLESDDGFCAACHVEPETTYYEASLEPERADTLAVFHAGAHTGCIDCHSRWWIPGRLWGQWGALQNLLAYRSGDYTAPSITTRPVGDGGCIKCHSDLRWVSERPGHYHSPVLRRRWRTRGGPANTCEVCHPSHESVAPASDRFMSSERIEVQCDACHALATATEGKVRKSGTVAFEK